MSVVVVSVKIGLDTQGTLGSSKSPIHVAEQKGDQLDKNDSLQDKVPTGTGRRLKGVQAPMPNDEEGQNGKPKPG
jgi:hypothetical protein